MRLGPTLLFPVLLCTALLTACEDEPEPKIVEPTSTAPPTTTATTSSAVPTTSAPPERETANQFIRRWQELADAMQNTGDTADYLALTRRCADCLSFAHNVDDVYQAGGHVTGGRFRVSDVTRVGHTKKAEIFEYTLHSTPTTVHRPGSPPERYPGGAERYQINLVRSGPSWLVLNFSRIPS